jgi:hypothetical protein
MAMHRHAVKEIGDFERLGAGGRFPAAYGNDFGFRSLQAGYHVFYVFVAMLCHRAWRSKRGYCRPNWTYGRRQGGFYAKHFSLCDR